MTFRGVAFGLVALCVALTVPAAAQECDGKTGVLGTSRVLEVDPAAHPLIGSAQYRETLPLAKGEVVLTFDDGPSVHNTERVLAILRAECVKATFFAVGSMAHGSPDLLRRVYDEGHTVGSHSQTHPLNLARMPREEAWREMETATVTLAKVLGPERKLAPFMRFPGLNRTTDLDLKAMAAGQMVWSVDIFGYDWLTITPEQVVRRSMDQLAKAGRGIILLHDIQGRTVKALPELLKGLKDGGYKVVHVVPAKTEEPKTAENSSGGGDWRALDRLLLGLPSNMMRASNDE